ncbi:MAG: hypothetical protein JHC34_01560 [Acidobacteria bacterium]|nr:hypothetical protein [Acidobacteriota bacterium]
MKCFSLASDPAMRQSLALAAIAVILLMGACEQKAPVSAPVLAPQVPSPWREAESVALAPPPEVETSIAALAAYLAPPKETEEQKARAIFRWVTSHVNYDLEGYKSGVLESSGADETLKKRSAVCEGYSNLFEALASKAGLECVTIHGFAKGAGYHVGAVFSGAPNHAWNAVRIEGRWRLVDCTWGAGALDEAGKYVHAFEPFYYDTPPEQFIYTHWPYEARWQLAARAISQEEFERLPWLKPAFFKCGLSFPNGALAAKLGGPVISLAVGAPKGAEVRAYLLRGEGKVFSEPLPCKRGEREIVMTALLPSAGDYVVRLYASCEGRHELLDWAADVAVNWNDN